MLKALLRVWPWPVVFLMNAGAAAFNWWAWACQGHWIVNLVCAVFSTCLSIFIPLHHGYSK